MIFHNVLQRAALAQDESLWNKYSISIVNTCLRFIATCLTRESGSFAQDSRFISILTSIMDVLLTVFAKVSVTDSQAILQAYEAILIILITALESPYYDSRQVISIVSPTIEQLQNTISKVPISSVLGLTFRSFRTSTIRLTNC